MPQIFSATLDRRLRRGLAGVAVLLVLGGAIAFFLVRSDRYWGVGTTLEQPIGFRHDIHVTALGIGCRFCHSGATEAASAGMPTATTCLTCHAELWRGVDALQPIFTSVELDQPIQWASLYRLPEHVRFHHGAHAAAGVTCATCHGEVGKMTRTEKAQPMSMAWCLDCHRPEGEERRQTLLARQPAAAALAHANPALTDCSVCHY